MRKYPNSPESYTIYRNMTERALTVTSVDSDTQTKWTVLTRVTLTLYGELASKANSRKLVTIDDLTRFIKSDKARKWEDDALKQIPGDHRIEMEGPIRMTATIYYASRRPDLDPSLLMDALEHAKVYKNDRQIVEQHLYKKLDPGNPRVELLLEELKIPV